ncbi:hypothetical protein, variant 1 [Plasmopara halstedii]|uniref:PHD-type domain-containing protein n=1 Tax=Plasmopara halstedii TaxID=4781 RepID=A0A0P1B6Z8_PLAHL|nr:hypothetical protein, variant 1 [Plasmopara halstedii]CEG49676.1 hypothetical protein, variant 1 [Plasmopara halstedii]|eukprot:XP_024586045.1 hypothetical protein, variant 1 [Plasmopara halstedii]
MCRDWLKVSMDTKKNQVRLNDDMADPQQDMPSTSTQKACELSSNVVPSERNEYPVQIAVDFSKLRPDALRRYMMFHGIPNAQHVSKEQLAVIVARHFHEECKKTDESSSLASFVTYLTGSNDTVEAAKLLQAQPYRQINSDCHIKENESRQKMYHSFASESTFTAKDGDQFIDCSQEEKRWIRKRHLNPHKTRVIVTNLKSIGGNRRGRSDSSDAEIVQRKKKRKGRLYCICKGTSFGNMIACDNKKCLERSNWYHMDCVNLDPYEDAPKVWYCPACQKNDCAGIPENQYRKPAASVTYGDMISHALTVLPGGKGSFKEICDFVEMEYESQLNWKLESDQRKSPVWKSSVRKILFSNVRFQKYPEGKGMFCLAA